MTSYKIDDIARDVRIALDSNMNSDPLSEIGDVDTLAVDEIIRSKIVESVKRIHMVAPVHLLGDSLTFTATIEWGPKGDGHIVLPEDFMRLVVFKLSDWERAVYHPISADDPAYLRQSSRFKGIRGTRQKPVCAVVVHVNDDDTSEKVLEFYASKSTDADITISQASYLPYPRIDGGAIGICEPCYNAVIYTIAALTLTAVGDESKIGAFTELAKSALI